MSPKEESQGRPSEEDNQEEASGAGKQHEAEKGDEGEDAKEALLPLEKKEVAESVKTSEDSLAEEPQKLPAEEPLATSTTSDIQSNEVEEVPTPGERGEKETTEAVESLSSDVSEETSDAAQPRETDPLPAEIGPAEEKEESPIDLKGVPQQEAAKEDVPEESEKSGCQPPTKTAAVPESPKAGDLERQEEAENDAVSSQNEDIPAVAPPEENEAASDAKVPSSEITLEEPGKDAETSDATVKAGEPVADASEGGDELEESSPLADLPPDSGKEEAEPVRNAEEADQDQKDYVPQVQVSREVEEEKEDNAAAAEAHDPPPVLQSLSQDIADKTSSEDVVAPEEPPKNTVREILSEPPQSEKEAVAPSSKVQAALGAVVSYESSSSEDELEEKVDKTSAPAPLPSPPTVAKKTKPPLPEAAPAPSREEQIESDEEKTEEVPAVEEAEEARLIDEAANLKPCSVRLEQLSQEAVTKATSSTSDAAPAMAPPKEEDIEESGTEEEESPKKVPTIKIRILPEREAKSVGMQNSSKETEESFLSSIIDQEDEEEEKEEDEKEDVGQTGGVADSSSEMVDAFSLVSTSQPSAMPAVAVAPAVSIVQQPPPPQVQVITPTPSSSSTAASAAASQAASLGATSADDGPTDCNICGKDFPTYQEMLLHRRRHKVTEALVCEYCSREYTDRNRYEIHIRWHTGELPFKCHLCGKGFREQRKLKLHIRRHNSDLGHKCHLCPRSFEGARSLAKHLEAHKNNTYVAPKVLRKADGGVALAMPPDPNAKKTGAPVPPAETATADVLPPAASVAPAEPPQLTVQVQPLVQPIVEAAVVAEAPPPQIIQVQPPPPPAVASAAPPAAVMAAAPVPTQIVVDASAALAEAQHAPITLTLDTSQVPAAANSAAVAEAVPVMIQQQPQPQPQLQQQHVQMLQPDTISLSMDDLMQYGTPNASATAVPAASTSLIHEHHANLEERLTETATATLPVSLDEFAEGASPATVGRARQGGGGRRSVHNDSGEFPDLLDSDSNLAEEFGSKFRRPSSSSSSSEGQSRDKESGLTFATLSGVSPEYPDGKRPQAEEEPRVPLVVARKSVAPDPSLEPKGKTKTQEIITALASQAAEELAKANITLPAGTCLVPAAAPAGGGVAVAGEKSSSLQVLPAVLTPSAPIPAPPTSSQQQPPANIQPQPEIAFPNKPMTITIQYKVFPDNGGPQKISVQKSISELISGGPPDLRSAFDTSSAASSSSAASTPIPPPVVHTAVKTRPPPLPSPPPAPSELPLQPQAAASSAAVPIATAVPVPVPVPIPIPVPAPSGAQQPQPQPPQSSAAVVASAAASMEGKITTTSVPAIEDQDRPNPFKETRTEVTAAGKRVEVPTIVTSGYDLDARMCTICNRAFKADKTLMGHMLSHFGVAPRYFFLQKLMMNSFSTVLFCCIPHTFLKVLTLDFNKNLFST